MDYETACDITATQQEARDEIEKHDIGPDGWQEFIDECGDKPEYQGQEVLDFLGY